MAGCNGWITFKVLELLLSILCMIYKRITDNEADKLFYFLQKYSREWPLLNNITWEENGAIFTDITYGGFIIITLGLLIAQSTGELQHYRKTENFFLIAGAMMFIATGSLELAALDSVEERLVDNAAILGVVTLLTGFVFILDLLLAGRRRKKARLTTIKKNYAPKSTQTENAKTPDVYRSSDMNGNIQNGGFYPNSEMFPQRTGSKKIPRNGVKILPTSPSRHASPDREVASAPPVYSPKELKTIEAKIRSTDSFLRSEKGEYIRRNYAKDAKDHIFVPPGYVLVPVDQEGGAKYDDRKSTTPPGYASVIRDLQSKPVKSAPGFTIFPIDQADHKNKDGSRKLQSPTVTTTGMHGYYPEDVSLGRTSQPSMTNLSLSDMSDTDEFKGKAPPVVLKKAGKYSSEYLQIANRSHAERLDGSKPFSFNEALPRADSRLSYKSLQDSVPKGRLNQGFEDEFDGPLQFRRNNSNRSNVSEKPKSILRFDRIRLSSKRDREEEEEAESKDSRYDSLDSRKIAEDLRQLRQITKSDLDLTQDSENGNEILRKHRGKEESEKKQSDDTGLYMQRRKLGDRINELEEYERLLKLEKKVRDLELERNRELEDEKDRRMSEREEQYFGILDLRQSQRESSPVPRMKMSEIEKNMKKKTGEGVKKVNEKLKEKFYEQDRTREDQEFRKVIDEGFYFLDEEEKKRKNLYGSRGKSSPPDVASTRIVKPDKSPSPPEESDETPPTEEEIRLRIETPSSSYKSEAQVWVPSEPTTPTSPGDPGFVLHTAQNWPENPSPQDRFRFSARNAQKLKISKTPSPDTDADDDETKSSKSQDENVRRIGQVLRRVDFTEVPLDEARRPATAAGTTSSWKKWLQPKPKFQHTKSAPT